ELARLHAVVGKGCQGGNIMAHEDALLRSRPSEHGRVSLPRQASVLNAHYVKGRVPPEQAAQDVVVEILVEGKRGHLAFLARLAGARQQARTYPLGIESPLVFLAHGRAVFCPSSEVSRHFRLMV